MSALKFLEIQTIHLVGLFVSAVFLVVIFAVPAADAWSHINNIRGRMQLSNDGNVVAFISERADVGDKVLIEDSNGNRIWDFSRDKTLNDLAMSPDGKYLAVVGNGVFLLSIAEKKILWSWTTDGRDTIAISSDGNWVAAGGYSDDVYIFQKGSSQPYRKYNLGPKEDYPRAVAVSNDGKLAAAAGNLAFYVFDTAGSSIKWQAKTAERIDKIRISNDDRYILGIAANSIYLWDKSSNTPLWQKKWRGSLIGAAMTDSGDKIVVSHQKGISVFNISGTELRHFDNSFGNSDMFISRNGRYIYANSGSRRIYSFDDSYSSTDLRPFRIIRDINSGGEGRFMGLSGSGSMISYPQGDNLTFLQQDPAIMALSPGIPIILKDQILDMGVFVTNPGNTSQKLTAEVRLSLPASVQFWDSLASGINNNEPVATRSKLLTYAVDSLPGNKLFHTEIVTLPPGTSAEKHFSETVPDLTEGRSFSDLLAGGMANLSPIGLFNKILGKFKGPLARLIGDDAANIAIATTTRAVAGPMNAQIIPVMGMGTVTLKDATGKFLDQDSFYFMYLK